MKKKTMVSLIALFVMGEMCNAEVLVPSCYLGANDSSAARPGMVKTATVKSEEMDPTEATNFQIISSAYNNGSFAPDKANYSGYPIKMELPADGASGDVTITGIYNFAGRENITWIPVTGKYDADASTVTITTPFNQASVGRGVKIGTYERGGNEFTSVMVACKVADEPDMTGQRPITTFDELVFDVAEDGTLTARTSWLVYSFGGMQNGIEDILNLTVAKPITEQASLIAFPSEVVFPEAYAGTKATEPLGIVNVGRETADCKYSISGQGLELGARYQVEGLSFNAFQVNLTAPKEGQYEGSIYITYNDGARRLHIPVKADVQKAIDFNSIVKNGDFQFSLTEPRWGITYNPWKITDSVTGHPVALASTGVNGFCGLDIQLEVPAGKVGIFSWKGICEVQQPNGLVVYLDGDSFADHVFDNHNEFRFYAPHPADSYVMLSEGKHTLTFEYVQQSDWYSLGYIDGPQQAYIWDLDLQTYDTRDEFGILWDQTVDFGTWYIDKFIGNAFSYATILNMGTKNLEIIGGENSESFEVVGIGRQIGSMESLESLIAFKGKRTGDYDETVTVKTNGGDFKVRCLAKAEKIINDYQYLVSEGDLSFGTSVSHPFTADTQNGIAFSSTAKLPPLQNDPDPDSWLSASFTIPEGMQGTLSWDATNSSNDYLVFMDIPSFTDGTQIFIDGEQVAEFAGICEASSADIDESYLTFGPGDHFIKFNYMRLSSTSEGNEDRMIIRKIGLKLGESSVESVNSDIVPVEHTYYTLEGFRIANPTNGIFIRKSILSDGTIRTEKVVLR